MLMTLTGITIGSSASLSNFAWSYYAFAIPTVLPFAYILSSTGKFDFILLSLMLGVFLLLQLVVAKKNQGTLDQSIILRNENINLVQKLQTKTEKAESASLAKTKFLAAASHDLRQPLHAMGLFLDLLEERSSNPEQVTIIDKIKKSSIALENLLASLLDISKLDARVITVKETSFDVQGLFDVLVNEFKPIALENNLEIRFINTNLWIKTDKQLIERILRNLISNAISYTEKGRILIGCRRTIDSVTIVVCDTGIGINKDDIKIIFEEFQQIDNPGRDRTKGLGLGLSIVTRLVDLIKAELSLLSKPGQGSMFSVKLPRSSRSKVTPTENPLFIIENKLAGKVIVIVEDEEEISHAMNLLLSGWGCKVLDIASSGEVNENKLTLNKPDMILADYRLQNHETGVDVIHAIHDYYRDKTIPAVIITGDTEPDLIKKAQGSGFQLMHKPVSGGKLRALLSSVLLSK
ncbi:MAG: hybrid sensor histidine kinase/response regulator, partial [Gammaproteobacteria bacterium]|nr:hybrid sensor histidine kinase/response regulator [Gammaproteobacteria bacterium]